MPKEKKKKGRGWHGEKKEHSDASKKGLKWKKEGIPATEFERLEGRLSNKRDVKVRRANRKFLTDDIGLHEKYGVAVPPVKRKKLQALRM